MPQKINFDPDIKTADLSQENKAIADFFHKNKGIHSSSVKTVYYPLAQSDIGTALSLFPNATNFILTGALAVGPLNFDCFNDPEQAKKELLIISGFSEVSGPAEFMSERSFFMMQDELPKFKEEGSSQEKPYPTILLIAAQIKNFYGVNEFDVEETDNGHSLSFMLDGIPRKVEYVELHIKENQPEEDKQKIQYLTTKPAQALIHKAIPFDDKFFKENPHALPVLCGNIESGGLVVSDLSFVNRSNLKEVGPTNVFLDGYQNTQTVLELPKIDSGDTRFGLVDLRFGYGCIMHINNPQNLRYIGGEAKPQLSPTTPSVTTPSMPHEPKTANSFS